MSKRMVELAVDKLLGDERLRIRFRRSRIESLADLGLRGIDLTPDEIQLFIQTEPRVWFWETAAAAGPVH
jgi:hypothetical protein